MDNMNDMDNEILNEIIDEFKALTLIPRKSHNEKAVSDYLVSRFTKEGYSVYQDEVLNVIAEKKVNDSDDFIILQGHMDMVCTFDDGINFDPIKDHVEMIIEGNNMHSKGTTLGADDGIGIAMALVLSKHVDKNIRIICTVDEEDGMTGAIALDNKYLQGKYLVNIDWEDFDSICNSSASGRNVFTEKKLNLVSDFDMTNKSLLELSIKGLEGGHSGCDIDKDRTNAIRVICEFLNKELDNNMQFNISSINGGSASNAIPIKCIAKVVVNDSDKDKFINDFNELKNNHKDGDKFNVTELNDKDFNVMSLDDSKEVVRFVSQVINGVYSMEPKFNIVESSSNIGTIETKGDILTTNSLLRSCNDQKRDEIYNNYVTLAKENNFSHKILSDNPSWPIKEGKIADLMIKAYNYVNNMDTKLVQVHAGLECSYFSVKNRDLDMISVGPTIQGAHTPCETLKLDTVMPIYKMIEKVMKEEY